MDVSLNHNLQAIKSRLRKYFVIFVSTCNGWIPYRIVSTLSGIVRE